MVSPEYMIYPIVTVLSITLLILAGLAYQKNKNLKMLVLGGVFTLFLIKGLIISTNLFFDFLSLYSLFVIGGFLDAFALFILYMMTLKV